MMAGLSQKNSSAGSATKAPVSSADSISKPSNTSNSDIDDEYDTYKQHVDAQVDEVEAKHVRTKIDRRVIPLLTLIYLMQYLDKNGINYASAYGLRQGTNLRGQDYSWLGERS